MRRKLSAAVILGLLLLALPAGASTNCQTFTDHSGHIPGSYDYAEFTEQGYPVMIVETFGEDIFVAPPEGRKSWDTVRKCLYTEEISQPISIGGDCIIDQAGVARAIYSAEGRPGAVFTVNGVNIGGAVAGGVGVFGVNTWSVVALEGYVIEGPSEGSFVIEDCTPTTTTTMPETTTTTAPVTTTTAPSTTLPAPTTTAPTPSAPAELPLTGVAAMVGWTLLALVLVGLGVSAVRWGGDE